MEDSILKALKALSKDEFETFKWHLQNVHIEGIAAIPEGDLEEATRTITTRLIMKTYPRHGNEVMLKVLKKIPRNDLLTLFPDKNAGPPTSSGVAKAGDAGPPPTKRVAKPGEHVVDQLRQALINKVTKLSAILDQLKEDGAISKEGYNTVNAESTNEDKMRKLDSLLTSKKAKDFFYQALKKFEEDLLQELEIHSSDDLSSMDIEEPRGTLNTDLIGSKPGGKGPVEDKAKTKREPESGPSSDPTEESEEDPENFAAQYDGSKAPDAGPGPADAPYKMTKDPGYCLILENTFTGSKNARRGSENDSLSLGHVFSWLGFTVIRCKDKTKDEMEEVLQFFAGTETKNEIDAEQWSKSGKKFTELKLQVPVPQHGDCFVCCILSHGNEKGIKGEDGETITVREIRSPFSGAECRDLLEKPKLFFIQACRGGEIQKKVLLQADDCGSEGTAGKPAGSLPEYADFLHGFANIDQHLSVRSPDAGSWYIQELCKQLGIGCKRGDDILRILTRVNAAVCKECGDLKVKEGKKVVKKEVKQSPGFESYLTKPLIFHRPTTVLPPTNQ